jgi:carboxypeptidase family protein
MRGRLALTTALVLLAAGCASSTGPPSSGPSSLTSKLSGTLTASPGCPGPQRTDRPCPDKPVAGGTVELTAGSVTVATTTTDANGRFELQAAPGRYTVIAHNSGYRSQVSQDVELAGPTEITLVVDSGMR